jgi:hypothetical protein
MIFGCGLFFAGLSKVWNVGKCHANTAMSDTKVYTALSTSCAHDGTSCEVSVNIRSSALYIRGFFPPELQQSHKLENLELFSFPL